MSAFRNITILFAGSLALFGFIAGTILLFERLAWLFGWIDPPEPWDPELVALAALEDLFDRPAYDRDGAS